MDEELVLSDFAYGKEGDYGGICVKDDPVKILKYFCLKLGLDPAQGDILIIESKNGRKPYITANGLRNATSNIVKGNISEMVDMDRDEYPPRYITYRCTVTTIDDRVFSQEGTYDLSEWKKGDKPTLHRMKSMAETRATSRTLRLLLGTVAKALDIYDELPEDVKKKKLDIDVINDLVDVEPPTDFLNEDLEFVEEEKPITMSFESIIEEPTIVESRLSPTSPDMKFGEKEPKKIVKAEDELMDMFGDLFDEEPQCPTLENELNSLEGLQHPDDLPPAAGHGHIIECIKMLNGSRPNSKRCIEILSKPESEMCVYFFDWLRKTKNVNYLDVKKLNTANPKQASPPLIAFERFTKTSIEVDKNCKANHWVQCLSDNDMDMLDGFMFTLFVELFDEHKLQGSKEYPDRKMIRKFVGGTTQLVNWIVGLFDIHDVELPEGG
jgi:hypothetical protein